MNMKKFIFLLLIIIPVNIFALPGSPMENWHFTDPTTLNGKTFNTKTKYADPDSGRTLADSYREQIGYALMIIQSEQLYLYDTISYHNGKAKDIYDEYIPKFIENKGYAIVYDSMDVEHPYTPHPSIVALMKQRGCDVAVWLAPVYEGWDSGNITIYEYLNSKNTYKRTSFQIVKR